MRRQDAPETHELGKRDSLVGLDESERQRVAADFFAKIPWEPARLDPGTMTAEEFLDAL